MKYNILFHAINGIGYGHIQRAHNIISFLGSREQIGDIHIASSSSLDVSGDGIQGHKLSLSLSASDYQIYAQTTRRELEYIIQTQAVNAIFHDTYYIVDLVRDRRDIYHFLVYRLTSREHFLSLRENISYFKKIFIPHTQEEFESVIGETLTEKERNICQFVGYIYRNTDKEIQEEKGKLLISPGLGGDYQQTKDFFLSLQNFLSFLEKHYTKIYIYPGKHRELLEKEVPYLQKYKILSFSENYIEDFQSTEFFIGRGGYNTIGECIHFQKKSLLFSAQRKDESQEKRIDFFSKTFPYIGKGVYEREQDEHTYQKLIHFNSHEILTPQKNGALSISETLGEIFSRKNLLIFYPSYTQKSHGFIADELYELGKIYNLHICVFNRFFHESPFARNNHIILYKEFTDVFYVPDIFPDYSIFDETQKKNYALFLSYIKNYCQNNDIHSCMCEFLSDAVFVAPLKKIYANIRILSHCRGKDIYVHFGNFPEKLQKNTIASLDACFVRDSSMQLYAQEKNLPSPFIIRTGKNLENYLFSLKNIHPMRIILGGRFVEKKGIHNTLILLELLLKRGKIDIEDIFLLGEIEREEQSYGEKLKEMMRSSPLLSSKVKMLGFLDQKEYKKYIQEGVNIFIGHFQKSKDGDEDGIPNVLSENMLVGNLVFSTLAGGIGDILIDSQTGYVLSGDIKKDAEKIEEIFGDSLDIFPTIVQNARKVIEENFDVRKQVGSIKKIIENLEESSNHFKEVS